MLPASAESLRSHGDQTAAPVVSAGGGRGFLQPSRTDSGPGPVLFRGFGVPQPPRPLPPAHRRIGCFLGQSRGGASAQKRQMCFLLPLRLSFFTPLLTHSRERPLPPPRLGGPPTAPLQGLFSGLVLVPSAR